MAKASAGTPRRAALRALTKFVAASPLVDSEQPQDPSTVSARPRTITPPQYDADIMAPINLHEFEDVAKRKLNKLTFDYISGGAAEELTLLANREAFERFWIRRRVMNDVSTVDTTLTRPGEKRGHPILLAPAGAKPLYGLATIEIQIAENLAGALLVQLLQVISLARLFGDRSVHSRPVNVRTLGHPP